jgi:2-phospho-L-lactate guanylyltransferase
VKAEIVIAVRGGPGAKSRLRGRLSAAERAALVEAMLADMLDALAGSPAIRRVHVATPTAELARLAAKAGAAVILERGVSDQNRSFTAARRRVAAVDPDAILALLPGDLPLLDSGQLQACLRQAGPGRVVLVPATADGGTGAVIQQAGLALPLAFGPDSFEKHAARVRAQGLEAVRMQAPSLGFDLDRPEDIDLVVAARPAGRTAALLRSLPPAGEAAA